MARWCEFVVIAALSLAMGLVVAQPVNATSCVLYYEGWPLELEEVRVLLGEGSPADMADYFGEAASLSGRASADTGAQPASLFWTAADGTLHGVSL